MASAGVLESVIREVVAALRSEARETNERRALVLAGERDACLEAARAVIEGVDPTDAMYVGTSDELPLERVDPKRTGTVMGATHGTVVFDAHDGLRANAIGQVIGAVDGGGLFILLTPALDDWSKRPDPADEAFAVPPFSVDDVTGRFRKRFVQTLRGHRGIAIVDIDSDTVEDDGLTNPAPHLEGNGNIEIPSGTSFPRTTYESCLTRDQVRAVEAFESLLDEDNAVVVEADRGRGKSSAAGLAAGALASKGDDVLITAPEYQSAREAFTRAVDLLDTVGEHAKQDGSPPRRIETATGGRVRFSKPSEAVAEKADIVIVDEAAALPVPVLSSFLEIGRVAFTTTIHGYEGTGRGFSVRFRDRLAASDLDVAEVRMDEPIRYAAGDPIEVWAFRALLLDATPPPEELIEDATPASTEYRTLEPEELLEDEPLLREAFGLLVLAHYRTEPDDLVRLLDAPNVRVRALLHEGHVASIALLAREGGLSSDVRDHLYEGGRVRGNMIPDVLTSQLGDEDAAEPIGWRVLRIATHDAVRSRGLGSKLLSQVREEFSNADWLGVGYGATPDLLSFWDRNGFSTVHLSTTRNDASGEHSAIMLSPMSDEGWSLHDHHATWFAERIGDVLADALDAADADVIRAALGTIDTDVELDLTNKDWRLVARMAFGPGLMDVDPGPFREIARKHLIDPDEADLLTDRAEGLLVRKVLQARGWSRTADELGFHSRREGMRATGETFQRLVDVYGTEAALSEAARFET